MARRRGTLPGGDLRPTFLTAAGFPPGGRTRPIRTSRTVRSGAGCAWAARRSDHSPQGGRASNPDLADPDPPIWSHRPRRGSSRGAGDGNRTRVLSLGRNHTCGLVARVIPGQAHFSDVPARRRSCGVRTIRPRSNEVGPSDVALPFRSPWTLAFASSTNNSGHQRRRRAQLQHYCSEPSHPVRTHSEVNVSPLEPRPAAADELRRPVRQRSQRDGQLPKREDVEVVVPTDHGSAVSPFRRTASRTGGGSVSNALGVLRRDQRPKRDRPRQSSRPRLI